MQLRPTDALLVIDVQNDFCPGGALATADGDAIVPLINSIAKKFDHVILTQDWPPPPNTPPSPQPTRANNPTKKSKPTMDPRPSGLFTASSTPPVPRSTPASTSP